MKKLLTTLALIITLTACGGGGTKAPETKEIKNGSGTEVIGTMTQISVPEAEITDEYLKNWYNQVKTQDNNYDVLIIKETDTNNQGTGYYYDGTTVWKDVDFDLGSDLIFTVSSMDNASEIDIK